MAARFPSFKWHVLAGVRVTKSKKTKNWEIGGEGTRGDLNGSFPGRAVCRIDGF